MAKSHHHQTQLSHRDKIISRIRDLYDQMRTYKFSHSEYLNRWRDLRDSDAFKRLTTPNREYVRGYDAAMYSQFESTRLIHAYELDGKILPINSEPYKSMSPQLVHESATWSGLVYVADPTKRYFGSARKNGEDVPEPVVANAKG